MSMLLQHMTGTGGCTSVTKLLGNCELYLAAEHVPMHSSTRWETGTST
jgi:hypothetical protein